MKKETFDVTIRYRVKYTNKEPVPIVEIVNSLQAYEKLLKRTGPFIEKSFEGSKVTDIQVYVSNLESGSLKESFLIKVFFENEEDYEQFKDVTLKLMTSKALTTVVSVGVGACLAYGVMNVLPGNKAPIHIEAYNGAIVQLGGTMNLSKDGIDSILTKVTDKKTLGKEAIDALSPSFEDKDAIIEVTDHPELNIVRGFIDESPAEYKPPQPSEIIKMFSDVEVEIYASDRDNNDKAWAGIVPGIAPHRVKFILDESIDPGLIHGKLRIRADIKVTSTLIKSKKEYRTKLVYISEVK